MSEADRYEAERAEAERARQEAEVLREEHEIRRRIGEGGPDQHVPGNVMPGRVEAEAERAAAEARRRSMRRFYLKIATAVALPLAFVALIPALIGIYLVDKEAEERTAENRTLIARLEKAEREQAEAADARRADFTRADVLVCRAVEKLKAGERARAQESYRRLDETLALLGIRRTPAIEERALQDLDRSLRRYRSTNCGELPSVNPDGG